MLTYLLAVFFMADSQHFGTLQGQCSLPLWVSLFINEGEHPDQAGCSTDWQGKTLTFSLFLGRCRHSLLSFFNLSLPLPPCDITKKGKVWCLVVGKSVHLLVIDYSDLGNTSLSESSAILCSHG